MNILIAADGSAYTERTFALTNSKKWRGRNYSYTVLYVVPQIPMRALSVLSREDVARYYEEEAETVFEPIRKFTEKNRMHMTFIYKVGKAAETIARTAVEGDFDLIIMGTQGEDSLTNRVMGSVVTGVMARCETPVLLLH